MTLTAIRNQALSILIKNETFVLSTDSVKIKVPKNLAPIKAQLIENALEILEDAKYVKKIKTNEDCFWIFESDVSAKEQNVIISPHTAEAVANIINQYREAIGIAQGECDKMNITEEDIQSLIVICGTLLNNVEKPTGDANEKKFGDNGDEDDEDDGEDDFK